MSDSMPPSSIKDRPRVPSGPRRPREGSSSSNNASSRPLALGDASSSGGTSRAPALSQKSSLTSMRVSRGPSSSTLDRLLETEHDFTISPEHSPDLKATSPTLSRDDFEILDDGSGSRRDDIKPAKTVTKSWSRDDLSNGMPISRPTTPTWSFSSIKNGSPIKSPPVKVRPKPSKLNTNLGAPSASPTRPVSPGLKHWQQVRQHVMAPTPVDEKPQAKAPRKLNLVSKAAGKLGFKQAAESMLNYEEKRQSTIATLPLLDGFSVEQQEEIARERRRFARDVKTCLDACAAEESRRRLQRIGSSVAATKVVPALKTAGSSHKTPTGSMHTAAHTAHKQFAFDPNFSSFAPLLTELHRHLPAARAKRPWSRTCPHHAAILAELGISYLSDGTSTDGERQQALEVFGVVVRNWSSDSAEEELDRWLWLCRALLTQDRHLRNRGLPLLASFLHADPTLPAGPDRPHSAVAFQSIVTALVKLLHAVERSEYDADEHLHLVTSLLSDTVDGIVMDVEFPTLAEVLGKAKMQNLEGSSGGIERELLWLAVGKVMRDPNQLSTWLLVTRHTPNRFAPPPILHATPPAILHMRALSTSVHLISLSILIRSTSTDIDTLQLVWHFAERHVLADIEHIIDFRDDVLPGICGLLLSAELAGHRLSAQLVTSAPIDDNDPFYGVPENGHHPLVFDHHRARLIDMFADARSRAHLHTTLKSLMSKTSTTLLFAMAKSLLQTQDLIPLGQHTVSLLLADSIVMTKEPTSRQFLLHLKTQYPQLLYKPLFSLSASTGEEAVFSHLEVVKALASQLGFGFWTSADPQMLVILLMGDLAPKQNKGKEKEGETPLVQVKLGRYVVLIELLKALQSVASVQTKKPESALRTSLESLESKFGAMLIAEERDRSLPSWYRTLVCKLFMAIRTITRSVKSSKWQQLVVKWYTEAERPNEAAESTILDSYKKLLSKAERQKALDEAGNIPASLGPSAGKQATSKKSSNWTGAGPGLEDLTLSSSCATLLVAIQACLSNESWMALLPHVWHRCDTAAKDAPATTFLLMKCAELLPEALRDVILDDLYNSNVDHRAQALRKLVRLYGWRHHVLGQLVLHDRKGPIFRFHAHTLEFVSTDIGSSQWVAPHEAQAVALQKFGTNLPLELRQRLMALGWNDDDGATTKSDWEQMPVSSLPSLQFLSESTSDGSIQHGHSPSPSLGRADSNGSSSSRIGKSRKAIFAPALASIIAEQAAVLAHDPDSTVSALSAEVVRLLQRDDPSVLLRTFTDRISFHFGSALSTLGPLIAAPTPGFAYLALNAIVGYLKSAVRSDPAFVHYKKALAMVTALAPHVSALTLRSIRKSKAEHVLLPASIHEEEGGFKVHQPWRDGSTTVQTAQLLFLNEILKANPRDVYIIKKMLSNLQIQPSLPDIDFARAWLILVTNLFSTINRNYNDRAELRHFLTNVVHILRIHGQQDLLAASHSMRIIMLCSARFRRLFASMGLTTIMATVYETYAQSGGNRALADCIEFGVKSLYRIHSDYFVYQTCVIISELDYTDAAPVYELLASLSQPPSPLAGVASGLRGLNDKEELEALVQMVAGPELSLLEIGTAANQRQLNKMASINLGDAIFPRENIVRLFITAIAANPASLPTIRLLKLFAAIIPHIKDSPSITLLRDGVEALAVIMYKGKAADELAVKVFQANTDTLKPDWAMARKEFILLVERYAVSGGQLSASATRCALDIVLHLLRTQEEHVGPAATSMLRASAKTHLSRSGSHPLTYLRDIAPIYRAFIASVDFSGLLDEITGFIVNAGYELEAELTKIIVDSYFGPVLRLLANASEGRLVIQDTLRSSVVELAKAACLLQGSATGHLERCPLDPTLLATLIIPLCEELHVPEGSSKASLVNATWIRLLDYLVRAPKRKLSAKLPRDTKYAIASTVLTLQAIKVILLRAPQAISQVDGLWSYMAQYQANTIAGGSGRFINSASPRHSAPRIIDWMMWSTYELVMLFPSPLNIDLRHHVKLAIAALQADGTRSGASSPGLDGFQDRSRRVSSSPFVGGRARMASFRSTKDGSFRETSPMFDQQRLSPNLLRARDHPATSNTHSRSSSLTPSPHSLSHSRLPSSDFSANPTGRPRFADLSMRRSSRATMTMADQIVPVREPATPRFPSSQSVRQVHGTGGQGGAIVHLLGAPNQVLTSTAGSNPGHYSGGAVSTSNALREFRLEKELGQITARAVRVCQIALGGMSEDEMENEPVRMWSTQEALNSVKEQTRLFIEEECRDLFVARDDGLPEQDMGTEKGDDEDEGYSFSQLDRVYDRDEYDDKHDYRAHEEAEKLVARLPILSISSP